jgi:hypothetical protein
MKIYILSVFYFFFVSKIFSQKKDTLYFGIDKYYTISPTINSNLENEPYPEWIKTTNEYMKQTKTNGYIFFIGDDYLTKNLKPKKVLSIKKYIENRKFYFDGKYNQIVDEKKVKDSLIDKYVIYFVNGDKFIKPLQLNYVSYYPRRDKDWNVVENKIQDTLYFKLDNEYIYQSTTDPEWYLIKGSNGNQHIFFQKEGIERGLTINKLIDFKEFVQSQRFCSKYKKQKLNEPALADFLSNYVVYFVKVTENEFIKVSAGEVVYD